MYVCVCVHVCIPIFLIYICASADSSYDFITAVIFILSCFASAIRKCRRTHIAICVN